MTAAAGAWLVCDNVRPTRALAWLWQSLHGRLSLFVAFMHGRCSQTYESFLYAGKPHVAVNAPNIIHIFSFSKARPRLQALGCRQLQRRGTLARTGSLMLNQGAARRSADHAWAALPLHAGGSELAHASTAAVLDCMAGSPSAAWPLRSSRNLTLRRGQAGVRHARLAHGLHRIPQP